MNESFKVGQKVRCVREDSFDGQIAFPGDVMTVTNPGAAPGAAPGGCFLATFNGREFAAFKDRFEAVEEPKAAFKVGDRVRVVREGRLNYGHHFRKGDVGDVTHVSSSLSLISVTLDESASMIGYRPIHQVVLPDDIELIPTPATETPTTDKALEWLKDTAKRYLTPDGLSLSDDEEGYAEAVKDLLREVYGLEVKTIPASVEFVAVPKAQPEFAF